jgi:hypothetical protein
MNYTYCINIPLSRFIHAGDEKFLGVQNFKLEILSEVTRNIYVQIEVR